MIGISPYLANSLLGAAFVNTSFVNPLVAVQLHTADPGADGTENISLVTTRSISTFSVPVNAVIVATGAPAQYIMTGPETIKYISGWDTLTPGGGNWLWSAILNKAQIVADGDTLRLGGGLTFKMTGIAAAA